MGSFSLEENKFVLAGVEVDPTAMRVRRDDQVERIEPRMMQVLLILAGQAGEVVTRESLERQAWAGRVVSDDAVTNTIAKLRRALGDDRRRPQFIETIPKRGYRLIPKPVRHAEPSSSIRSSFSLARWLVPAAALVLAIGLGLYAWLIPSEEQLPPRTAKVSIAVLPLTDRTGQDDGYFIDGLTQDIIEQLGRQPQVSVVAPAAIFGYRDVPISDRSLGEELGARFLVRGDISRSGEEIALNLRMIDTNSGSELWAQRFTGSNAQFFNIKEQIIGSILTGLRQHSTNRLTEFDVGQATDSLDAYDEFLRGRRYYGRLTPEDNAAAMHHFKQAIALDPQFARAYAALALTWTRRAIDGWTEEPEQSAGTYYHQSCAGTPDHRYVWIRPRAYDLRRKKAAGKGSLAGLTFRPSSTGTRRRRLAPSVRLNGGSVVFADVEGWFQPAAGADAGRSVCNQTGNHDNHNEQFAAHSGERECGSQQNHFEENGLSLELKQPDGAGPDIQQRQGNAACQGELPIGRPGFRRKIKQKTAANAGNADEMGATQTNIDPPFTAEPSSLAWK